METVVRQSVVRQVWKVVGYTIAFVLFVVVVLAGFTQSKMFKERLRLFLISTVTSNTNGTLSLGTIHGNFVTGFSIDSATLYVDGGHILSTGKIDIAYDFLSLPRKRVLVQSLTIEHPRVTLLRAANDSLWNFEKLFRRQEKQTVDAVTSAPFSWSIHINRLNLINGAAVIIDSLTLVSPQHEPALPHQVEYHNIAIDSLNLACRGTYDGTTANLTVERCSFDLRHPEFTLRQLTGEFSLSPSGISAQSLAVETQNTRLNLAASLEHINLLDGIELEDLKDKPVKLRLLADDISLNELKSFIAPIDFLEGSAYIDLDVRGTFSDLFISRLELRTYNTELALSGSLRNLHRPDNIYIDVNIDNSVVQPDDVDKLLPAFHIPRFENAGTIVLNARYTGRPLNFTSVVQIHGEAGSIDARTSLNLQRREIEYDCSFQTRNVDVSKLWPGVPFHSLITSRGTIKGSGTSIDNVTATVAVVLDSTLFQDMMLTESAIDIQLRKRSIAAQARLNSSETRIAITVNANYAQVPTFHVESDVQKINLARVLKNDEYGSSLSFRTVADIYGSDIDTLSGNLMIHFFSSSFQTYEFEGQELKVNIERKSEDSTHVTVLSPVADFTLSGKYSLASLIAFFTNEYQKLSQAIDARIASFRVSRSERPTQRTTVKSERTPPFNAEFSLVVKNLRPLSIFFGDTPFDSRGNLNGTATLDDGQFALVCTTNIAQIFVGTVEQGFFVEGSKATFTLRSIEHSPATNYLDHLYVDLDLRSDHGIINKRTVDNLHMAFVHFRDSTRYSLVSTIDSISTIAVQGHLHPNEEGYHLGIDSTRIVFGDLSWVNDGPITFHIGDSSLTIAKFDLRKSRDVQERISLGGSLAYDGTLHCQLLVRQFTLRNFGHYVKMGELLSERGFTGTFDLSATMNGSVTAPILELSASGKAIAYRGKTIGTLIGTLDYRDRSLSVDLGIGNMKSNETRPTDLVVRGTIPIDLAFSRVEQRFPDKPIDLLVASDGFAIDVLDPMLTTFDDVRGKLFCNVRIGGTPATPLYNGTIILSDLQFLFVPNNVLYYVSGTMEALGDKIQFSDVQVRNDRKDRSDGIVRVNGYFSLRNFAVESFDLSAQGQLLLMKETTRRSREMYGTLFAATGPAGLHYWGSFNRSYLTGSVLIREANLVFPPTRETNYGAREVGLPYVVIDDTSRRDAFAENLSEQFFTEHTNGASGPSRSSTARTIWDGMSYDVIIETQGTTEIRMIFNQATNEELFAALEGRVVLQRGERGPRMNGEISVGERSYYNFFKRFSARGSLKFVGQPDNPELNITASYEGIRTIDTAATGQKKTEEHVVITLDITGTRYEPKLVMSMTVDGIARRGDVESDAIPFILTGKFLGDLTSQEKTDIATSLGSIASGSLLYGLPSQMLSGVLSDFLQREIPIIRRAEITYVGGNLQESADLRLSGEIGKAYWRAGGRIFNSIGNANVSVQLSMGEVFESIALRNLFLELERKVETGEGEEQKKLTNAARIFFRISF